MKYSISLFLILSVYMLNGCSKDKNENSIKASGTIETINVTISSKSSGQVKKIYYDEGARIKAGDLLLEIDHNLLDIQLRDAEASVEIANAQLRLLQSKPKKEEIKIAEQSSEQAKINLEHAKTDLDRIKLLYNSGAVTEKQYDDAKAHYDLAVSQYNSSKENLNRIKTIVHPQEIEQANANLKKAQTLVDLRKQYIDDCKIYSNSDGIITKKFIEQGENVVPNTSLFKISNLESVNLIIYISEAELGKINLGQKADVTVDSFKDKTFKGEIIYISPEAEFTPKNIQTEDERTKLVFAVKIHIPNFQLELKSGMPADATIIFR